MVIFHDRRGRTVKVNLWDVIVPGVGRPAIRRESASSSKQNDENKGTSPTEKEAEATATATPVASDKLEPGEKKDVSVAAEPDAGIAAEKQPEASEAAIDPVPTKEVEVDGFTEAQDKQLLELKDTKKKSWQEIVSATGKPKKALTKRYGDLKKGRKQPGRGGHAGSSRASDKGKEPVESSSGSSSSNNNEADTSANACATTKETTAASGEPEPGKTADEKQESEPKPGPVEMDLDNWSAIDPGNELEEHVTPAPGQVVEGQDLDMQEILYLCRLHNYFNEQKWVALSAKLFDRSGKHISAEALKQKFKDDKLI